MLPLVKKNPQGNFAASSEPERQRRAAWCLSLALYEVAHCSAPTVRKVKAQGAALGKAAETSLKPQRGATGKTGVGRAPLGLDARRIVIPRAAPWALTLRTFGAEYKCATSKLALGFRNLCYSTAQHGLAGSQQTAPPPEQQSLLALTGATQLALDGWQQPIF